MKISGDNRNILFSVLVTLASYLAIAFAGVVMLLVSLNYQDLYHTPKNTGSNMDMNRYNLAASIISATMSGEWEFYYNKWIVTDGLETKPDATINVPGRWTGMKINGESLSRFGYASYKMVITNPREGSLFTIRLSNYPVGCRAFINGKLNMTNGTVSKEKGESTSTGLPDYKEPYVVTDESELEVVIEVGYNGYGGLFYPPWLKDAGRENISVFNFMTIMIFLMVGAMAACVLFSFVIHATTGSGKAKWVSILFILLVFLHVFTTNEFNWIIGPFLPFNFFSVLYELCFVSAFITVAVFLISLLANKKLILNRVVKIVYICIFALVAICYYLLFGTKYQVLPIVLWLSSLMYVYYKMLHDRKINPDFEISDLAILFILTVMFIGEFTYNLGYLTYGLEAFISLMLLVIMVIIGISAFFTLRKKSARALRAAELEKENEIIKYNVYKSQVNPHFIFNTLSSIQALYKQNDGSGDEAIGRFSRHLRRIVNSSNAELHSFNEELKIIMNYIELEKMRLKRSPQVLFDINFQDFLVPVLSLQPLIENALRYSGIVGSEAGYIRIFSDLIENQTKVVLIVEDNGKGFDVSGIQPDSTGLKNTAARYSHLLNADMIIKSAPDKGTAITILLPYKEAKQDE